MSLIAKAGKYALTLFLGLVCICLYIAVSFVAYYLMELFGIDTDIYEGLYSTVSAVLVIICFLIYNRFSSSDKQRRFFMTRRISVFEVILLIIISLGLIGFVTSYLSIFVLISDYLAPVQAEVSNYEESVDRYAEVAQDVVPLWDSIIYAFAMAFLIPISEEMVFRGALFGHMARSFRPWVAVLLTAGFFGALHGMSIHIGYALICGVIITFCYYYTGSLTAPVIIHSLFNILGSALPFMLSQENLSIPRAIASQINSTVNITAILFMVPSVFAFISLIRYNKKRMRSEEEEKKRAVVTEACLTDE